MTRHKIGAALLALALGGGTIGVAAAVGGDHDAGERVTGPAADRVERAVLARFPGARVTAVVHDGDDDARWEAEVTRADGSPVDVELDPEYRIVAIDDESDPADDATDDDAGEPDDDAGERDDGDARATDPAADRAGAAALARVPGGRVTSIERDADGDGLWEVEVTRSDGSTAEVDLDAQLRVIAVDDE